MAKGKFTNLINSEEPVLIDFFATWCEPCKMLSPTIDAVAKTAGTKAKVVKIDIDKNPVVAERYNIRSVPTLMIFKKGEIKWRQAGMPPKKMLLDEIEKAQ